MGRTITLKDSGDGCPNEKKSEDHRTQEGMARKIEQQQQQDQEQEEMAREAEQQQKQEEVARGVHLDTSPKILACICQRRSWKGTGKTTAGTR